MFFARAAACLIAACIFGPVAEAGECPGHPGALGTSRIMAIDPAEHHRVGLDQYSQTLPLDDHEVVLTFDDGPSARNTKTVLDALAAECVKATFFIVGSMARRAPGLVKREYDEGHTIGTHTQDHAHLQRLSKTRAWNEIDDGIASASAALGDPKALSPFFRFPYLDNTKALEEEVIAHGLMIWSVDFAVNDWMPLAPEKVLALALRRLEKRGKGMILFHDIQRRTAIALPKFMRELKKRGYKIVHVAPADSWMPTEVGQLRHVPANALN